MGELKERILDEYAKYRAWFNTGFTDLSLPIAIASCGGSLAAVFILEGWTHPLLIIGIAAVFIVLVCIWWGRFQEIHKIPQRINSRLIKMQNKEGYQVFNNTNEILKQMEKIEAMLQEIRK